jgi:hypothetical protein
MIVFKLYKKEAIKEVFISSFFWLTGRSVSFTTYENSKVETYDFDTEKYKDYSLEIIVDGVQAAYIKRSGV